MLKKRPLPDDYQVFVDTVDETAIVATLVLKNGFYAPPRLFVEHFPQIKQLEGGRDFQLPATDMVYWILKEICSECDLKFTDDAKIWAADIESKELMFKRAMSRIANWRAKQPVSDIDTLVDHPDWPLKPHQKIGALNCIDLDNYCLFFEQGTGKTATAIAAICNTPSEKMRKVLIVCPKNCRLNWQNEIYKFSTLKARATILRGGQLTRVKLLFDALEKGDDGAEFTAAIITYETFVNMSKILMHAHWDFMILDESHYIKSPNTQRTKAMLAARNFSTRRLELTGTPIDKSMLDLYTQLEFAEHGGSGFSNYHAFKRYYGKFKVSGDGFQRLVGIDHVPEMKARLARRSFIVSLKEALPDLPDKTYDILDVEMTKHQAEIYKELSESLMLEIEDELENSQNKQLLISNILVMLLRLAEITSGYVKFQKEVDCDGNIIQPESIDRFDPNPKIELLSEILSQKKPNQKTIVWACFKQNIRSISARLKLDGIKHVVFDGSVSDDARDDAIHQFNNDFDTKVFVGNARCGGAGVNLLGYPPGEPEATDTNCDHAIYFSQNWSSIDRAQSEYRNHRHGSRVPVRVTDLCIPGTIDEEIRRRVVMKRKAALEISDVREILSSFSKGK